jgi:hypothetical protein
LYVGCGSRTPELYSVGPDWFEHRFIKEKLVVCREFWLASSFLKLEKPCCYETCSLPKSLHGAETGANLWKIYCRIDMKNIVAYHYFMQD